MAGKRTGDEWVRAEPLDARAPNHACNWRGYGADCPMMATGFAHGGDRPGLCSWHDEVRINPRADTYEEFEKWCEWQRTARYCSAWTHHTAFALWDALHGVKKLGSAQSCLAGRCPHRTLEEQSSWRPPPAPLLPESMRKDTWRATTRETNDAMTHLLRGSLPLRPKGA